MSTSTYLPYYRKSHALVIGIDKYTNPSLTTLGAAQADAEAIASILGTPKFGFDIRILLGEKATRETVLRELHKLRDTDPDDRILVYFAGHGYTVTDNFGKERGYVATVDTVPNQEYSALGIEEITILGRYAGAKHISFVFDTCFSGQALGLTRSQSMQTIALEKLLTRRAHQVISAGAGDQTVDDFQSMSNLMVEGLEKETLMNNGILTMNGLGLYLQQEMTLDSGKTQIPQFGQINSSQGGDVVLLAKNYKLFSVPNNYKVQSSKAQFEKEKKSISIQKSLPSFTAEVDLSGRIDDRESPTVLTISAGLSVSIWISGPEKQKAIIGLSRIKSKWGSKRINIYLYTLLLFLIIKDNIHKLDLIAIDTEYFGYDGLIKQRLIYLCTKYGIKVNSNKIKFGRLEKVSQARIMAGKVYKGDADPDFRIMADDLLSIKGI